MLRDGDKPAVGSTGKTLGVRIPPDEHADIPVDGSGIVAPNTGGMSVVPDWRKLMAYQIPKRLRHLAPKATGSDNLACWRFASVEFAEGAVADGLQLRIETPTHGLIEPSRAVPIERFAADLRGTRDRWVIDEE